MTTRPFDQFRQEILGNYNQGKYREALVSISEALVQHPERAQLLLYWNMCMYGRLNDVKATIQEFQKAIDAGYWYAADQLADDDADLLPATSHPEFIRLREIAVARYQEAVANSKPELLVLPLHPNAKAPYPLLLVLHGNNNNAEDTAPFWRSLTEQGWLVALAQSSQTTGANTYIWNDHAMAVPEIQAHLAQLKNDYAIDENCVVVGGFSAGAGLACRVVLKQDIKAKGFVALGAYIASPEELLAEVNDEAIKHVHGVNIIGDQDESCLPGTLKLTGMLKEHGIACQISIIEGIGHSYPVDFAERLCKATKFILNR
ncbi:MAG: hypothetical protein HY862_17020 [Chloroflexi bacterium]|nr:hypothetical protein [Chloroflexota bacterium]